MRIANHQHGRTRGHRTGVASLEFVMALPFLVFLTGILFTMAYASLAKSEAVLKARNQAWHARYGGGSGGTLNVTDGGAAERLAALAEQPAFGGLVSGSGSAARRMQKLQDAPQYVSFGTGSASARHSVFSNPWDHETIAFPPQAPLSLDRRVSAYGADASAQAQALFAELLQGIKEPPGAAALLAQVEKATAEIDRRTADLDREIRNVESRLRELRDRLRVAEDDAVIRELERAIDRLERVLQKLNDGRDKLGKAQGLGPS